MVTITGNTFPVKEKIKALGGRWNADARGWDVPDSQAREARALVSRSVAGSRPTATTRAAARRAPLASGSFQSRALRDPVAGEKMIHRDGRGEFAVGETTHAKRIPGGGGPDGCYWTVVECGSHRISEYEDDCREGEWRSDAIVRPAAENEWQPVAARIAGADAAKNAKAAALVILTTGQSIGRDDPAGKMLRRMASEPGRISAACIEEYESGIYHIQPVYDDSPISTRLTASAAEIDAAITAAGWLRSV